MAGVCKLLPGGMREARVPRTVTLAFPISRVIDYLHETLALSRLAETRKEALIHLPIVIGSNEQWQLIATTTL